MPKRGNPIECALGGGQEEFGLAFAPRAAPSTWGRFAYYRGKRTCLFAITHHRRRKPAANAATAPGHFEATPAARCAENHDALRLGRQRHPPERLLGGIMWPASCVRPIDNRTCSATLARGALGLKGNPLRGPIGSTCSHQKYRSVEYGMMSPAEGVHAFAA